MPNSYHAQLVGVNFRPGEAKEIVKALIVGDPLTLEREPFNEHDENAIKVMYASTNFLGYIERGVAAILAPQLDNGISFTATVNHRLGPLSVLLAIEPTESAS